MEDQPHRSPDEEPAGPEDEQLYAGEIDLTGVVRQDEPLADVIGDALAEAEGDGTLPEWGARSMARALANERDDPLSGALHHYAITGHADPEAIARELIDLYEATTDGESREWINWLGVHVIRMPDQASQAQQVTADETASDAGSSSEAFGKRLRQMFAEADARSEPISSADAQALATLLSIFLDPGSQMARFADTGDANPVELSQECQAVRHRTEHLPGADRWIAYFEQHLASRSDLGRQHHAESASADRQPPHAPTAPTPADDKTKDAQTEQGSRQAQEGIRRHGDAFHAYLSLADVDPQQDDLLQSFLTCYVGVFESMDTLVNSLVMGAISEVERAQWAADGVSLEDLARSVWDIVDISGKLYVFNQ